MTPTRVFEIVDDEDKSTAVVVSNFNISLMVKETNDKYLLTKEELGILISKAYEDGQVFSGDTLLSHCNNLPTNGQEYLKTIL